MWGETGVVVIVGDSGRSSEGSEAAWTGDRNLMCRAREKEVSVNGSELSSSMCIERRNANPWSILGSKVTIYAFHPGRSHLHPVS